MINLTSDDNPAIANSAAMQSGAVPTHLLLVDDDDFFRESLGLNLIDEGFAVTSLSGGGETLEFFEKGGAADVLLLDWRMPQMDGLEVLRQLRRRDIGIPVIFLTALSDDIYEEAALEGGAVDFIDKSRRLSILLKRLSLIIDGIRTNTDPAAPSVAPDARPSTGSAEIGSLVLRFETSRALWHGEAIDLTLTEFNIVVLLATRAGQDIPYRDIYDLVHGKDFIAGYGVEGYRANVRTFIKRIRKKFRDVDPKFGCIDNYAGFGYRWHELGAG
ncbi:MAG TPA: response regulator transcription factor [Stellaceae bacterium]|nr:response regulator transcription factor [Stellaceae bacterium]